MDTFLIRGTDSAGKPDYFYYSKKGYESPDADLRCYWFWSSSVKLDDPLVAYTLKDDGDIRYSRSRAYYYNIDAVRCVW